MLPLTAIQNQTSCHLCSLHLRWYVHALHAERLQEYQALAARAECSGLHSTERVSTGMLRC